MKLAPGEACRVLACGIDSLVLSTDLRWRDDRAFGVLERLKSRAKADNADQSGRIIVKDDPGCDPWLFAVKPNGARGHEWVLNSGAMTVVLGNWMEPQSRPSAMIEFRSLTLWTMGPTGAVAWVNKLLAAVGATVEVHKLSRLDACVDVLLPKPDWSMGLLDRLVTRAEDRTPYLAHKRLKGITVGKGVVLARLYDKNLEIIRKSGKTWMYAIWGLSDPGPDHLVVRVEFQHRREALKDLGLSFFGDLEKGLPHLWAYDTQKWLRLVDDADLHHTQQTLLPWWAVVQGGMTGAQNAQPLLRAKAIARDKERMKAGALGYLASMSAIDLDERVLGPDEELDMQSHVEANAAEVARLGMSDREFTERVKRKQTRATKAAKKHAEALAQRQALGLPSAGEAEPGTEDTSSGNPT